MSTTRKKIQKIMWRENKNYHNNFILLYLLILNVVLYKKK